MDRNDKDELRERLLKGIGKEPSYEEKKRQREAAKAKRTQQRRNEPRARAWSEDEDEDEDERMRARDALRSPPRPRALVVDDESTAEEAVVVGIARTSIRVRTVTDELDALTTAHDGAIAVGDVALIERVDARTTLVRALRSRRTRLSRPDPGDPKRERVLAANVDVAVIVASAAAPAFKPAFLDRMLVAVAFGGVEPIVCINKIDLAASATERRALDAALDPIRGLSVPIVLACATQRAGIDALRALLDGKRCVFVGHSGVGKSSLVNALDPLAAHATGVVRASDGRGRHTTTSSALREAWPGTEIVDTPGVRQFGLWGIDRASLAAYFPDLTVVAQTCRFRDCSHLVEPECGVQAAVTDGRIAASRLAVYARLRDEIAPA